MKVLSLLTFRPLQVTVILSLYFGGLPVSSEAKREPIPQEYSQFSPLSFKERERLNSEYLINRIGEKVNVRSLFFDQEEWLEI